MAGARFVGHVVQVAFGVGVLQINGGREYLTVDGQRCKDCFDGTRGAQEMSGHGLSGADGKPPGVFTKGQFYPFSFGGVVDGSMVAPDMGW